MEKFEGLSVLPLFESGFRSLKFERKTLCIRILKAMA